MRLATHRLAGLGPAQFQDMAASRLAAEVVIERHDAVDLGARQIQRIGQHGDDRFGHKAQGRLNLVQYLDQRIRPIAMLVGNRARG